MKRGTVINRPARRIGTHIEGRGHASKLGTARGVEWMTVPRSSQPLARASRVVALKKVDALPFYSALPESQLPKSLSALGLALREGGGYSEGW